MSTIKKVFLLIGIVLLCLIVWAFVFGGGLAKVANSILGVIDKAWQAITGSDDELTPKMEEGGEKNLEDGYDFFN